ncbi:MAG: hypothetical protein ACI91G_000139 [Gammaproteobacteria bacterium]|jgi:hypothetical protein
MRFHDAAIAATLGLSSSVAFAATPSNAELYEIIQAQQAQLEELNTSKSGFADKLYVGGYGELHYNNIKDDDDKVDFHRFVLFFGYDFSDGIRFRSEFELEHALAGEGKPGEVELEQAYVEFNTGDSAVTKAGVFLVPVGILNETHEPPTFYGVERNGVEKNIIPSTWWEAGAMYSARASESVSYDIAVHSGLQLGTDYKIRGGRQKVAKATANDLAATARIKYTGIQGVELAATLQHQADARQGLDDSDSADATLIETHAAINKGAFGARVLYATWDVGGAGAKAAGRDEQTGYYLEGSYKASETTGFFTRYSAWDNNAGNSADTETTQVDLGVNYWPHANVVVKADLFKADTAGAETEGFNLGVGYQF